MTFTTLILINAAVVVTFMLPLWAISLIKKDASIVDPCWGLGFVIIAWATAWQIGLIDAKMLGFPGSVNSLNRTRQP